MDSGIRAINDDGEEDDLSIVLQHVRIPRDFIYDCIEELREEQEKLWGEDFDDLSTANDWVTYMMQYLSRATSMNRESGKKLKPTPLDNERYVVNMLRAIAIGVASLEVIARNGTLANRHYDLITEKR